MWWERRGGENGGMEASEEVEVQVGKKTAVDTEKPMGSERLLGRRDRWVGRGVFRKKESRKTCGFCA